MSNARLRDHVKTDRAVRQCASVMSPLRSPRNESSPEGVCPDRPEKRNKCDSARKETKQNPPKKAKVRLSRKHEDSTPRLNETGNMNTEGISWRSHAGVMILRPRIVTIPADFRQVFPPTEWLAPTAVYTKTRFI